MAENMEGKNLDEKVKNSLRKMIRSCDNYIKEAKNLEQLEDNLKHMEETDESFHKHELVQILSDQLESKLGDLIDRSVNDSFNSSKFEGDIDSQNRMAEKICHDIIKHKEFLEFKSTFQTSTNKAVDNLMKNFHANFIEMNINSDEVVTLNEQNEVKSISFSNDLEYSSPDNSMNQNSFVFVTSEQFPTIAQNLDLRKPEEVRMRAMHQLLAIPASDPQAADHWIQIRRYLIATLRDPCASIANLCLKLHSRTLASSHYKVSVEIYINLVEHLSEYFRDRELEKRALKPSGVVDFASPENSFILKIFRLTNDYAKDITTKWTRYPDSFVETIINETLKLLNLASDYKFGSFMTSLHFLSVIDIKAIWFTKWMHGNDSRKTLINSIKKQELFLQTAVNSVLQYASVSSAKKSDPIGSGRKKSLTSLSLTGGSNNSSSKRMQFRKAELDYTHFVHSLNVLKRILSFKNGRQLFPVKISNREITIKDLIKIFIQIIFDTSGLISSSEFSPSKCTYELLQDLCVTEETCEACLCNEEVIEQLLKPIKSLQMTSKKNQFASSSSGNFSSMNSSTPHLNHNQQLDQEPSSMLLVANILSKLASTQCGYKQLIFNDSRQNFLASSIKNSPARTIASFVEDALNNHISLPIFELAEYLYLARLLYSKCQGAFLIAEYSLNMCIADAWINCDSSSKKMPPAPSPAVRNHSSLSGPNTPRQQQPNQVMKDPYQLTWPEALLDNLVSMASTTKGVVYLNQTNLINPVANYLSTRYRSRMQVSKYEKFGYGFIISQLSNAPTGTFYLNECAFVQYLIEEIWTELAYGSDDFMSAFPRSYSVEPIDKEVYKPMLCLMNIASSFPSAYELLVNLTATPRAQYGVRDVPKGLVSLLDRVVFLDKKLKISSLCNYEQSHMFGLRLLGFLQSDLDILLLIESQYQSTRLLLNLQKSNRANNKGLCIDYENTNNTDSNMPSLNLQDNSEQLDEDDTETETYDVDDSAEKKDIIIDLLSVERNFVLVNSNIIGGPGEKLLPERYINDIKKIYKYPLFDQLPVPSYYIKKADYSKMKSSSGIKELIETFEFDKLIKGSQESQREWTNSFKTRLLDAIRSFEFKSSDIGKALGQYFKIQAAKSETTFKLEAFGRFKNLGEFIAKYENTKSSITLSNIQKLGIEKTIQYGIQIGLLEKSNRDEYTNNLTELHKQLNVLLKRPNRKSDDVKVSSSTTSTSSSTNPTLAYCDERNYPGYDWFASLMFLLNSGETNATVELLVNIASSCLSVELLWPAYQYARGDNSGVSPLLATTCHYVELILKTEQPLVFSAFRMSGLTPAQICLHWIKQCFLNHIDWPEIVAFLVAELVLGIDYQTYFCVVLLKHMNGRNQSIVQHHTNRDLQFFLRGNQIENFKVTDYLEYMHEMEGKYRHYIDEDVQRTFDKDKIEK